MSGGKPRQDLRWYLGRFPVKMRAAMGSWAVVEALEDIRFRLGCTEKNYYKGERFKAPCTMLKRRESENLEECTA